MGCDICGRFGEHHPRCPKYTPLGVKTNCAICQEEICVGEEYLENVYGEYCHWDCFSATRKNMGWLGHEIKIMEGT